MFTFLFLGLCPHRICGWWRQPLLHRHFPCLGAILDGFYPIPCRGKEFLPSLDERFSGPEESQIRREPTAELVQAVVVRRVRKREANCHQVSPLLGVAWSKSGRRCWPPPPSRAAFDDKVMEE